MCRVSSRDVGLADVCDGADGEPGELAVGGSEKDRPVVVLL